MQFRFEYVAFDPEVQQDKLTSQADVEKTLIRLKLVPMIERVRKSVLYSIGYATNAAAFNKYGDEEQYFVWTVDGVKHTLMIRLVLTY